MALSDERRWRVSAEVEGRLTKPNCVVKGWYRYEASGIYQYLLRHLKEQMGPRSPKDHPAFGFSDLHGFKDFVSMVITCAPDLFLPYDWLGPDEQLNLGLAFDGLRFGIQLAEQERGKSQLLTKCLEAVEESHALYESGRDDAGRRKLEEIEKLLNTLRTQ